MLPPAMEDSDCGNSPRLEIQIKWWISEGRDGKMLPFPSFSNGRDGSILPFPSSSTFSKGRDGEMLPFPRSSAISMVVDNL
jgi:hypothetical protein